jgi:hypothetical protein
MAASPNGDSLQRGPNGEGVCRTCDSRTLHSLASLVLYNSSVSPVAATHTVAWQYVSSRCCRYFRGSGVQCLRRLINTFIPRPHRMLCLWTLLGWHMCKVSHEQPNTWPPRRIQCTAVAQHKQRSVERAQSETLCACRAGCVLANPRAPLPYQLVCLACRCLP